MHPAPPVTGGPRDDDLQEPVTLPLLTLSTSQTIYPRGTIPPPTTCPACPPLPTSLPPFPGLTSMQPLHT